MEFKKHHRGIECVKRMASNLNIKIVHWSEEQIKCIEQNYPLYGRKIYTMFNELFSNKSEASVFRYASDHNIPAPRTGKRWTEEENNLFKEKYNIISLDEFCKLFPKLTKQTIKAHANHLGVAKKRDKKIICIETKKIYNTFKELEIDLGYNVKVVCPAIKNNGLVDFKYHFMYLDDYEKDGWKPKEKKVRVYSKNIEVRA